MKWEQLVELGLQLPEVTLDEWYGTPSLKVRRKGFVRLRPEGDAVVFLLWSLEEQEFLCETRPELYYITDHYVGSRTVLARLHALRVPEAKERLEIAWQTKAPPALIRARDQGVRVQTAPAKAGSGAKRKAQTRTRSRRR